MRSELIPLSEWIANSHSMKQLIKHARRAAKLDVPLLIEGETGTGKEMLAKACHQESSRVMYPFLALNCAGIPDESVESELFGFLVGNGQSPSTEKKGFFEQANHGTVLLDQIEEMSSQMQSKLLRFINDGTFRRVGEDKEVFVDVRIICATQKNLFSLVKQGKFREDLYYRLNVITLSIPPLRERRLDIMPLAHFLLSDLSAQLNITSPRCTADVAQLLMSLDWPGNIRQLKNTLYQSLVQLDSEHLSADDLVFDTFRTHDIELSNSYFEESDLSEEQLSGTLDDIMGKFEKQVLQQLYIKHPSSRKLGSRLGISHTAIANKLKQYNIR
ncbi:sigma 54-interacting transcriptional regulator [Thorsellia anophelis]|uniref:HTH-type transcriptional regulatory protein TyrR n=1 Tax=Thorsellia anophelis DSM 18579 TaxID=1123402 RepID=A0A1I0DF53_9GAMM|nr:sigma 54-interacting transcriptional regulator [Thorsellia anophelis]SET30788.1 TyrR family helix-turn-helix domain-containing protein [Thorsellia anophelis DSM 18579]